MVSLCYQGEPCLIVGQFHISGTCSERTWKGVNMVLSQRISRELGKLGAPIISPSVRLFTSSTQAPDEVAASFSQKPSEVRSVICEATKPENHFWLCFVAVRLKSNGNKYWLLVLGMKKAVSLLTQEQGRRLHLSVALRITERACQPCWVDAQCICCETRINNTLSNPYCIHVYTWTVLAFIVFGSKKILPASLLFHNHL